MTAQQMKVTVATAIEEAKAGVEYSPRHGAICPWCGRRRIPTYKTMPWGTGGRVRYHHCPNSKCLLHDMGAGIKSVQGEG
jgi:hypothetical protein